MSYLPSREQWAHLLAGTGPRTPREASGGHLRGTTPSACTSRRAGSSASRASTRSTRTRYAENGSAGSLRSQRIRTSGASRSPGAGSPAGLRAPRCEPGRALLDGCGMTVARVEYRKQRSRRDLAHRPGDEPDPVPVDLRGLPRSIPLLVPPRRRVGADRADGGIPGRRLLHRRRAADLKRKVELPERRGHR